MGLTHRSCHRDDCQRPVSDEWAPWCGQLCWRIEASLNELPVASAREPVARLAAVRHAPSWLDVRAIP